MHRKNNCCRVCGYELSAPPWGDDGNSPTWEICPCCGTEFGYEDCTPASARNKRQQWISGGMKWFNQKEKPENWSFEEQVMNVLDEFL
ncbi:putative amidophosphoribosyltransferase [Rhizobium sp. BK619]|uniref:hypothetical protein n=1 Tax=Rhizobium sp. BK619 TaxID=2586989 RepID=UPI001613A70A|nr:hypothetical protein [Rhizobium sp. BK619]MBB3644210.1 putative amidophosphoribosyltransferase [Rhizobium sp. BK619]